MLTTKMLALKWQVIEEQTVFCFSPKRQVDMADVVSDWAIGGTLFLFGCERSRPLQTWEGNYSVENRTEFKLLTI